MLCLPMGGWAGSSWWGRAPSGWGEGGVISPWARQGSPEVSLWGPAPAPSPPALAALWALPVGSCSHPELCPELGPWPYLPAGQRLSSWPPMPWGQAWSWEGHQSTHSWALPPGREGRQHRAVSLYPRGEGARTRG